ncbi:MAG: IS1595 family transposase [Candidatus Gracilibacteria bacterium]
MIKYTKLSTYKIGRIFYYFFEDFTATQTAKIMGINRNSVNLWYNRFREAIVRISIEESKSFKERYEFGGEFELDESYFGARRVRGKRGRGAAGKTPVFGLLKRDGRVFVSIVENCSRSELMPIIHGKILEGSTIYTDGWKAYDSLVLNGYDHYRVFHSENEFARGKNHVNGIESFWSFCKRRMAKFNGIAPDKFHLRLKGCEFRYNYKNFRLAKKAIFKNLLV